MWRLYCSYSFSEWSGMVRISIRIRVSITVSMRIRVIVRVRVDCVVLLCCS